MARKPTYEALEQRVPEYGYHSEITRFFRRGCGIIAGRFTFNTRSKTTGYGHEKVELLLTPRIYANRFSLCPELADYAEKAKA